MSLALLTLVVPALVGCNSVNSGSTSSSASSVQSKSEIEGKWVSGCAIDGDISELYQGVTYYFKDSLSFSGSDYTFMHTIYTDPCVTAALIVVENGTFAVGGADAQDPSATDINFIQTSKIATATSALSSGLGTGVLNGLCHISAQVNVAFSIAGLSCWALGSQAQNGGSIQNIFSLSGNNLNFGYSTFGLGNQDVGTLPTSARPSTLVSGVAFSQI